MGVSYQKETRLSWARRFANLFITLSGIFSSTTDDKKEGRDGYDVIEWIAEQPWSNGSVALVGNSWLAIAQW